MGNITGNSLRFFRDFPERSGDGISKSYEVFGGSMPGDQVPGVSSRCRKFW